MDDYPEIPYVNGYDAGLGFGKASGNALNLAIKNPSNTVNFAPGGSGKFEVLRVETTEDLETALGVSADAKAGIALFKVSASDKFEFSKSCKLNTYSLAIVVRAIKETGYVQINNLELTDAAAKLAQTHPEAFSGIYGDCFIRGLRRGGQFYGVVRIDSRNGDDRTTIKNTLDGAYGLFSAELMISLSEVVKQTSSRTEVLIYYRGGSIAFGSLAPDQIAGIMGAWSLSVDNNSAPYAVQLASYSIVNGFNPPNEFDLGQQRDVLVRCSKLRSYATTALNQVEYILLNQTDFISVDLPTLTGLRSALATDLDLIAEAASFAIDNPKQALEPEDYARIKQGLANYKLTILPASMPSLRPGKPPIVPDYKPHPRLGSGLIDPAGEYPALVTREQIWCVYPWDAGRRSPVNFWDVPRPILDYFKVRWPDYNARIIITAVTLIKTPFICGWMKLDLSSIGSFHSLRIDVSVHLDLNPVRTYSLKSRFLQVSRDGAFTERELLSTEFSMSAKSSQTPALLLSNMDGTPVSCPVGDFDYYSEVSFWEGLTHGTNLTDYGLDQDSSMYKGSIEIEDVVIDTGAP